MSAAPETRPAGTWRDQTVRTPSRPPRNIVFCHKPGHSALHRVRNPKSVLRRNGFNISILCIGKPCSNRESHSIPVGQNRLLEVMKRRAVLMPFDLWAQTYCDKIWRLQEIPYGLNYRRKVLNPLALLLLCALNFLNYAFSFGVNFENRPAHYSAQDPGHEEVRNRSSTRAPPHL